MIAITNSSVPVRIISTPPSGWCDPIVLVSIISAIITFALWITAFAAFWRERKTFKLLNNPHVAVYRTFLDESRSRQDQYGIGVAFKNFGKTVARDVQLIGRWATDEIQLLNMTGLSDKTITYHTVTPDVPMHNFVRFEKGKGLRTDGTMVDMDVNQFYPKFLTGELPLFLRCEIYYRGLDNLEYVNYHFATYDPVEHDFSALRNYSGLARECPENLARYPKI